MSGVSTIPNSNTAGLILTSVGNGSNSSKWTPPQAVNNADATELQGVSISATAPLSGQALVFNGTLWVPSSVNASSIDGVAVSGTPTSGQVIIASSGTAAAWGNQTAANGGNSASCSSTSFGTGGTTVVSNTVGYFTNYMLLFTGSVNFTNSDAFTIQLYANGSGVGSAIAGDALNTGNNYVPCSSVAYWTAPSTGSYTISLLATSLSGTPTITGTLVAIGIS